MERSLRLDELNHLYELLSPDERDELLQGLLTAAPRGGEAMIEVLDQLLLCHATDQLPEEHRPDRMATTKKRVLFDAYLMVDWSAASIPRRGKDSIWYCLFEDGKVSVLANPATRAQATEEIQDILLRLVSGRRSVLVGFDFPYAYPAGLSRVLGVRGAVVGWRAIWQEWTRLVTDDARNANNRFMAAAQLNARLSSGPAPFWGCHEAHAQSCLSTTKPQACTFSERRVTEQWVPRTQPVWRLYGAGSVGSQALVGIPRLEHLRSHPQLAPVSRVWPFEWNDEAKEALYRREILVLHTETYPSLISAEPEPGEVRDAVQVRELARYFAAKDANGELVGLLDVPTRLPGEQRRIVVEEEGWILGVARHGRAAGTRDFLPAEWSESSLQEP